MITKKKTAFIRVCQPIENGKILNRKVPQWAIELATKFNWDNALVSVITKGVHGEDRIYVEIGEWNEKFYVSSQEDGFTVQCTNNAFSDSQEPKKVNDLNGVVDIIRKHINKCTEINLHRAIDM